MAGERLARALAALVVLTTLGACGNEHDTAGDRSSPKWDPQPETIAHSDEIRHFDNLDEMLKASDAVIVATVVDVGLGVWRGEPGAIDSTRMRAVELRVDRVLFGSEAMDVDQTVVLDEAGWTNEGIGFQYEGVPWLKAGDSGIFAVMRSETGPGYSLVNTQARFLFAPDGIVASGAAHKSIHREWMARPQAQLVEAFARVAETQGTRGKGEDRR